MKITRNNSLDTTPGPSDWFTGEVHIDAIAAPAYPRPKRLRPEAGPCCIAAVDRDESRETSPGYPGDPDGGREGAQSNTRAQGR